MLIRSYPLSAVLSVPVVFTLMLNDQRIWCHGESKVTTQNDSAVLAGNELVFSHIIFRHGDRNPFRFYRNDPFRCTTYWKEGLGQLTDKGKQQLFDLGKYLRRRYRNLLNNQTYSPDLICVQSSHLDRTKQSAEAAIAGFFGQKKLSKGGILGTLFSKKSSETHESITVNILPKKTDNLIYFFGVRCARYDNELKRFMYSNVHEDSEKYLKLFMYLQKHTGQSIRNFDDVFAIYDTLLIEKSKNFALDKWTRKLFHPGSLAKDMEDAVQYFFKRGTGTKLLARLKSGFLIRDMLDRFTDKSQSKLSPNYSFFVYSGHDLTVFSLLHSLELNVTQLVPYGACILFELYKPAEGDHYVQLYYKNTTAEVIHPINIPNCGTKCTLEQFRTIYQDIIPTEDFETECQLEENNESIADC